MGYKTTDGLMRHLRQNGIAISGSAQKRLLINTGYFHGYKGYRFFKDASHKIPFTTYEEVYATIQYDSALKALLYGKVMFIETAIKNVAMGEILKKTKSEGLRSMFDKAISSYQNAPSTATQEEKKKLQQNKLDLQKSIQIGLANAYGKKNPKITHFYNNARYSDVPIWALFEIISMGDLGHLLSCLTIDVREAISREFGISRAIDTDYQLIYKYIYTIKDLRNAIAHNLVVFDTRFNAFDPNKAMKRFLQTEVGLPYVNFETIGDYVILISFFLKKLHVTKTEQKAFIREFERITADYKSSVSPNVAAVVIHSDLSARMSILKSYI